MLAFSGGQNFDHLRTTNRWVALGAVGNFHEVHPFWRLNSKGARHQVVATFFEHHLAVESKDANQGLVEVGLNADVVLGRVGAKVFQRRHSRHVVDHRVGHSDNHIVDVVQGQVDLVSCT